MIYDDCDMLSTGPSQSSTPSRKKRTYPGGNFTGATSKKRQRSDMSESAASSYSSYHEDQMHRNSKQVTITLPKSI